MKPKIDIEKLNLKQEKMFQTDEAFFNELEKQIFQKTIDKKVKWILFKNKKTFYYTIAAASILLFLLVNLIFLFNPNKTQEYANELDTIKKEEIKKYLISEYHLTDLYENSEINVEEIPYSEFEKIEKEMILNEIENYNVTIYDIN